jgi:hypothetical protein
MPRTRRARDKQIDGFRRVTRNMRGGNDIIGGSIVTGKDGKAIARGNTVTCSGLFGSKTFKVDSIDTAKKLVNPGKYAAGKCTKVDPNATVKDTKGFALKVNHDVTCKGLFGSSTFKIAKVDGATGKVFDAKNNGYVAATKCTYQPPSAPARKKTDGRRSAIRVQIKEADIKTYKIDIERLTGSILLGYTKKDGSLPVQLGGNMNPDGTLEEEGGALKTLTTLSTYILIFKDTIIPKEFETGAAKDSKLKSRINVDIKTTPVPSSYAQLIARPSSSGRETAVKIQITPANLSKFKGQIEAAAGFKILGYTDKSGKNPQQLGGSSNPDGTFDEEGGALKTITTLSTYIVIFNGPVNTIAFESKVGSTPALKAIMNVDNKTSPVPASFQDVRAGPGASGKETAVKIQIKPANLAKFKGQIEAAAGHKILGYTDKSGKNPQQLGGALNPDGTFDEEGGALATITTLSTYIVIFNGAVNVTAFASKVASTPALKAIMNVDNKTSPVPASFNDVRAGTGASGTETAVKIQIKPANLSKFKADIEKAAGHKILGYTDKSGKNPQQLGGALNPDGTFDEEGGALATITTLSTYIVIFNGAVNVTAFASKVASTPALKAIMNVDTKTSPVPASFNDVRAGPGASGTQTAIKIQIKPANLTANKEEIEAAAGGHKILGYTDKSGKKPVKLQAGGSLNPDGTFDEEGGALATITMLSTYIVVFNGAVNPTAFASKVASTPALKKIMNVDTKLTDVPSSFTELLSAPPPSNTGSSNTGSSNTGSSNTGSSAPPEEQAAAVEAAADAPNAAAAAEAVASTTSDPVLVAAAERAAAKPGATPASVQRAVQAAAAAAPAAAAPISDNLSDDTALCRLPNGKAGTQPSWEPDQDYPNPVSVLPAQVPSSMEVSVTGISEKHIQPTKTKIGTRTLYYTFVLIKGKVFGITAAASSIGNAIELMQAKMNKESGVIKLNVVTPDIAKIYSTESAEEIQHLIESLEATIATLQDSAPANPATAVTIQKQIATHKKTISALKIALPEYKRASQSGGRRKSRKHYSNKLRSSRRR